MHITFKEQRRSVQIFTQTMQWVLAQIGCSNENTFGSELQLCLVQIVQVGREQEKCSGNKGQRCKKQGNG